MARMGMRNYRSAQTVIIVLEVNNVRTSKKKCMPLKNLKVKTIYNMHDANISQLLMWETYYTHEDWALLERNYIL